MSRVGRNEPCPCGSGRKAKRCCGVERGPSDESLARAFLAHAGREAAGDLLRISDAELDDLLDEVLNLPMLDLSLHAQLPELASPALESLCQAVADDDPDAAQAPFVEVLVAVDTPLERARIARAIIGLRATGRVDPELAAAALIDLASGSRELLSAALLEAAAVRGGAISTPAGILLAA
jgi:SEC-C motif